MSAPLFILIGASAAGKTSVLEALLQDPAMFFVRFLTTTSRAPRPDEQNNVHYHFVSPAEFEQLIAEDRLFEWVKIYHCYYGTEKAKLATLRQGTRPILCVLEPEGARKLKQVDPQRTKIILIEAPREQLIRRLHERLSDPADITQRIQRIDQELVLYPQIADVRINNPDGAFAQTIQQVQAFIQTNIPAF